VVRASGASLLILLSGCGDASKGGPDGGGGSPPTICEIGSVSGSDGSCRPAGVAADSCGDGFEHDGSAGCSAVLPAEGCPDGMLATPGESTCHAVAPCDDGPWGGIPIEPTTQHVDASYGGAISDGSAAQPWRTVQEAVDAAPAGAIVAVAAGSYQEDVTIAGKPVRLWGRCPALVEIVGSSAALAAVQILGGAGATEVRDLAIRGDDDGMLISASSVTIDRVWIHDTQGAGIGIEDTLESGQLLLSRSLIERTLVGGVVVLGVDAVIEQTVVRDVGSAPDGMKGYGISVEGSVATLARASVTMDSSVVRRAHALGILVSAADATIASTLVSDIRAAPAQGLGYGIHVQVAPETGLRSNASIVGCVVEQFADLGISVAGSDALVESTVVRLAASAVARGIEVGDEPQTLERANVTVRNCLVDRAAEVGVLVGGSDLVLEASAVRDTSPNAEGKAGRGVIVQIDPVTAVNSNANITDCHISRSFDVGVLVAGATATVNATLITATYARALDGTFGDGLAVVSVSSAASATVVGSRLQDSARAGLGMFGAAVSLTNTELECNAIQLDGETFEALPFSLDNAGGNVCGCAGVDVGCKVLSSNLPPPTPQ
jgi:hypothetical protein